MTWLDLHDTRCLQAGLDLAGLGQDHAALVVAERFEVYTGGRLTKWRNGVGLVEVDETADYYLIRHITRWPQRMDPGDVVAEAAALLDTPQLSGARLRYDATGIGGGVRSVVRELHRAGRFPAGSPIPVTVTSYGQAGGPGQVVRSVGCGLDVEVLLGWRRGALELLDHLGWRAREPAGPARAAAPGVVAPAGGTATPPGRG
jgi:hypothetical protein